MDKYISILRTIIKNLELIIPKYNDSVNDPELKSKLLDSSILLADKYHNIKKKDILKDLMYISQSCNILSDIKKLLSVTEIRDNINTMSDLQYNQFTREVSVINKLIINLKSYITDTDLQNSTIKIPFETVVKAGNLTDIYHWYIKIPKNDDDIAMIETVKTQTLADIYKKEPIKLPSKLNCNLVSNYSMSIFKIGSLKDMVGYTGECDNLNDAIKILSTISKQKRKPILLIKRITSTIYNTLSIIDIGKSGLTVDNVKALNSINKIAEVPGECLLLIDGDNHIDLLKSRYDYSPIKIDKPGVMPIILDTFDLINWRELVTDYAHLLHLYNGINYAIHTVNTVNKGIMAHKIQPKVYNINKEHTPIAHLRNTIKNKISYSLPDISKINDFVKTDVINNSIRDILTDEFKELSKSYNPSTIKEVRITFFTSCESYVKKFNRVFNIELDKVKITKTDDFLDVIDISLKGAINEDDNPYDKIDEKRYLFSIN